MEVLNAVNLVGGVHREGNPVQALLADHARETGGVVRLSSGPEHISFLSTTNFLKMSKPQDAVEDGLGALAALLQGVRVARLAQRLVVGAPVEGLVKEEEILKYQIL